jgi:hypothetical protein
MTWKPAQTRVRTYEQEPLLLIKRYKLDGGKRFLSRKRRPVWEELGEYQRLGYIRGWERQIRRQMVPHLVM